MSSNKQISSEEMLNPSDDLSGYINGQTAESIGIEDYYYSVWSHFNGGNSAQLLIPINSNIKTPYIRVKRSDLDFNYRLLTNADLDGHVAFLSGGETALEAGSGNTRYRLQIDTVGNVLIFKSTDGGSTWPTSKVIASM